MWTCIFSYLFGIMILQLCYLSKIFRSEDTFDDQRSSIGSPSSTTTKEDKDITPDESMDAPQTTEFR